MTQRDIRERFFNRKLDEAQRHLEEVRRRLETLGQKLDAAKIDKEVDVEAEVDAVEGLIWLHNDAIESAQDAWLREDLSRQAIERLQSLRTPASLGLPMFFDTDQTARLNHQGMQISARLAGRDVTMGRIIGGAKVVEAIGAGAGILIGVGIVAKAFQTGGKWAVVKTVAVGAAAIAAEQGVEHGLRAAGANETVVRGFRLAAAVVSFIILKRRLGSSSGRQTTPSAPQPPTARPGKTPASPSPARPGTPKGSHKSPSGRVEDADGTRRTAPAALPTSEIPKSYINTKYAIDMTRAPAGSRANAAGYARNSSWFWRQMSRNRPELFSQSNKERILLRKAPIVDDTWIQHHPMHQSFKGDILVHHHIDQGSLACGLPQFVHRRWHSQLHTK